MQASTTTHGMARWTGRTALVTGASSGIGAAIATRLVAEGQRVPAGAGLYAATKHAVRALTESLRLELREAGDPIRVGEICPGFVETGFAAHYWKSAEKARETYSQFKVLEAGDVAQAVISMLACPEHVQVHDILMRPTEQPT